MKMKKYFFALALPIAMLCACDSDLEQTIYDPAQNVPAVLESIESNYELTASKADETAIVFKWSKPEVNYDGAITSQLQMDLKGEEFSGKGMQILASVNTDASYEIKTSDLNDKVVSLLEAYEKELAPTDVEIRLYSFIAETTEPFCSNVITTRITPYEDPKDLYMTGSNYGWGGTWNQLVPINGVAGEFWSIYYLHADEEIKFAPQAGWGNDFGGEATINDEAGSGMADSGGNLKIANAGWYLLHVGNGQTRFVNVLPAQVYLIGETVGDWSINDNNAFTVPNNDSGEFASPAFANSNELRMCVKLSAYEWWQTEFMIFNGKIEYRGNGGDQERVNVNAGQKVYLNFTNNTGRIE